MILDNKRHLCLFAAAFIFGIILFYRPDEIWFILLLLLGAAFVFVLWRCTEKKETVVAGCLTAAVILCAFLICYYQNHVYQSILNTSEAEMEIELAGVVVRKEMKSNNYLYYLNQTTYLKSNQMIESGRVLVYSDEDIIPVGSVVKVRGSIDLFPHASNEGEFDMADYYQSQNISFRIFSDSMIMIQSPKLLFRENLYRIQKQISEVFETELNERDAGILSTLVLGNKGLLDNEIKQLYQGAGISHILAISGLHISILGFGIYHFLRKCHCSYWSAAGIGSMLVFSFALMSGMGVSAQRALTMYLLIMGAEISGRTYDAANALALAALVILVRNPLVLFQSGFLFSFSAMIAFILFVPMLQNVKGKNVRNKNTGKRKEGVCIRMRLLEKCLFIPTMLYKYMFSGFILQLFMMPLTAWFYYEVPLYALFLNLLVIPLCSWLLGFGLLGGITGLVFPELSKWILVVCHIILSVYEKAIEITELFPFSHIITGQPRAWLLVIYYFVLSMIYILWKQSSSFSFGWKQKAAFLFRRKRVSGILYSNYFIFVLSKCFVLALSKQLTGFLLSAVFLCFILLISGRECFQVSFLDVGQGDGIYIADGDGRHIMIDGGSTSERDVGNYRIEPFLKYHGVKKIDAWIVTHGDEDHCSGVLELLQDGYEVDYLLLAKTMPRNDAWYELVDAAGENDTKVLYVSEGDVLDLRNCDMECLFPSGEDTGEDANALSQVWSLKKDDMSILFTGDIGSDQEEVLIERKRLDDYVVLKVPHHGSKYSSCEAFLGVTSPEYAIISCGESNRYGHPHAETLDCLEKAESNILQTQYDGQITFFEKQGTWHIIRFCGKS